MPQVENFEQNKRSCRARLAQRKQRTAARSRTFANLMRRSSPNRQAESAVQPAMSDAGGSPPCSSGDSAGGGQLPPAQPSELLPQYDDVWQYASMTDVTSPAQSAHALPPLQMLAAAGVPQPSASMAAAGPPPAEAAAGTISEEMLMQLLHEELGGMLVDGTSSVPAQAQHAPALHGAAMHTGFGIACAASTGSLAVGSQQQPVLAPAHGMMQPMMVMQQPLQQQLPGWPAGATAAVNSGMVQPGAMAAPCMMLPTAAVGMQAHPLGMRQGPPGMGQGPSVQLHGVNVNVSSNVAALKQQYVQVQHMLQGLSEQLRIMAELEQAVIPAESGSAASYMQL